MRTGRFVWSLVLLVPLAFACGRADGESSSRDEAVQTTPYPRFDGGEAYRLVQRQVRFGPRVPGTGPHRAMAEWLETYLRQRADTVIVQRFTHVTAAGDTLPLVNFRARFNPGPRPLLFLCHWDTRPVSDKADDPDLRSQPVPGANDGASGTAVLQQLAELMAQNPPPGPVDLLFVDGEDYGDFAAGRDVLLGSRHFAEHLPEGYRPRYGVLLDMIGDRDLDIYIEGHSNRLAPEVVDRVWGTARRLGFRDIFHPEVKHTVTDDHIPLNEAGIPTANVIDMDYPYHHTPEDTLDKVAPSSLGVVGAVMTRLIYRGG